MWLISTDSLKILCRFSCAPTAPTYIQTMIKYNEKTKGNGRLPLAVTRPTPKSSFPFLLLLLLIPTALYGWYQCHTFSHHKNRHLFGKIAEKAFLYVYNSTSCIITLLTFSSAVLYPMKPAQLKPPVFMLQSHT